MSPEEQLLQEMNRLQKENDTLRYIIADSDLTCLYCGQTKADMDKCVMGFPGCGRMDDLVLGNAGGIKE